MKLKKVKILMMFILFGLVSAFTTYAVNEEAVKLGEQYLEKAQNSYMNSDMPNALFQVNLSTDYNTTFEALAFKVQLEFAMGDRTNANNTMKVIKVLYPDDIRGNILNALLLSLEYKDGNAILKNLETGLKGAKTIAERIEILSLVEHDDSFEYFRVACVEQYKTLLPEIAKLNDKLKSGETVLTAGQTKWEAKWYGPRLWLSDEACKNVHNGTYVANVILKVVPQPYKTIIKVTLKISDVRIQNCNNKKHRGVILGWSWINAGSATFAVTSQ